MEQYSLMMHVVIHNHRFIFSKRTLSPLFPLLQLECLNSKLQRLLIVHQTSLGSTSYHMTLLQSHSR